MTERSLSYRDAGVDLDAARRHTQNIASMVAGGVGGFAGGVAMPPMRDPLLLGATDGVGTKLLLAAELGDLSGLGQDLVAMCVNDLICSGARPIMFLDYLAVGVLDPAMTGGLVQSISAACDVAGCALVGGETAELPGIYAEGHFDLAGFSVGVVERDAQLGPDRVSDGDAIIGIPSSGFHSNGYSLIRRLREDGALDLPSEALLAPTRIYVRDVLSALDDGIPINSAAHITGGGLPENLPRALPAGHGAHLDPDSWFVGQCGEAVLASGRVERSEAFSTFNMGLGMCLIAPPEHAPALCEQIDGATVVGAVLRGDEGVFGV